jgi:hypothetical protein
MSTIGVNGEDMKGFTYQDPKATPVCHFNCPSNSGPGTFKNVLESLKFGTVQHGRIHATYVIVPNLAWISSWSFSAIKH